MLNLSTAITINKHVIIASSPTDANGVPINYVHSIERSTTATNDVFLVNAGGELHLSRVNVHGRRTLNDGGKKNGALVRLGSNNPNNPGKFYLHSGATLRGGNRTAGGSAVLLVDGIFYMNGGTIQSNYTPGTYTLIGALEGATHNEAYLIAGEVRNNTGAGNFIGIRHSSFKEIVIGGDFVVADNKTHEAGNLLPHYGALHVKIINNFTERRKFYATGLENYQVTIIIVDEDFVPLETQPEVVMFYESYNDAYLYPHYINGRYIWKYFYDEDFSVVTKPTATSPGMIARKAHINDDGQGDPIYSNTNYVDEVELPMLNSTDYENITFNSDTNEITYEYVHEGETFVLTYPAPATNYVWRVTLESTLTGEGEIVLEHPDYPGVVFETVTLPSLSLENYTATVTDDDVIYTYTDGEGVTHEIKVTRPEEAYSWDVTSTPTLNAGGSANLTHPDFAGIVFATETLPKLDSEDYVVTLSGNEVIYSYVEEHTGLTISFSVPLPS